ncbi:MAG: phosphoribosyl-AMP cyclohydrolase [Armatimonadetes bacterium]|jgi:phosphoribosyl-AMP cyclohydrolase|nr:phosphoribosyl-AMP cyclohydrolase [Armatimonadota bacterium]
MSFSETLKYDANGLIPAVVQDADNNEVLMVAYMNAAAVDHTLETKRATYWSRSRQKFWIKGETSGHVQHVVEVRTDCDKDCLLIRVRQVGAACHDGYRSCFYRATGEDGELAIVEPRLVDPKSVYK